MAQLLLGLWLYGVSVVLLLRADLGLDPWNVLHQGIAKQAGLSLGTVIIATSVVVLALWVPLRQRPGVGTIANAVLVGIFTDLMLAVTPVVEQLSWRVVLLLVGVALNGVATGLYIGARLGPGPRDGLMTGLAARGHSIRAARTAIEGTVLALGWLLGGTVGVGTVVYAVAIGPCAHVFIPLFTVRPKHEGADRASERCHL